MRLAIEETLEDSFCAELVEPAQHGMAFGVLATVNGVGDFLSSVIVGLLWSTLGSTVAFGYSAVLFLMGAVLVGTGRFRHLVLRSAADKSTSNSARISKLILANAHYPEVDLALSKRA